MAPVAVGASPPLSKGDELRYLSRTEINCLKLLVHVCRVREPPTLQHTVVHLKSFFVRLFVLLIVPISPVSAGTFIVIMEGDPPRLR